MLPEDKLTLLCTITIAGKNIISSGAQKPATCQPEANIRILTEVGLGGNTYNLKKQL